MSNIDASGLQDGEVTYTATETDPQGRFNASAVETNLRGALRRPDLLLAADEARSDVNEQTLFQHNFDTGGIRLLMATWRSPKPV